MVSLVFCFLVEACSDIPKAEISRLEGEKLRRENRDEESLAKFQEALGLDTTLAKVSLHSLQRFMKQFLKQNSSQAQWGIGRLLLKYGQAEQALPFFRKAVKYGKKYKEKQGVSDLALSVMFQDMGVCLGENGLYAQQARAFNQSLGLHYRCNMTRF